MLRGVLIEIKDLFESENILMIEKKKSEVNFQIFLMMDLITFDHVIYIFMVFFYSQSLQPL